MSDTGRDGGRPWRSLRYRMSRRRRRSEKWKPVFRRGHALLKGRNTMHKHASSRRALLLAGTLGTVLAAWSAFAQTPPPSWQQGRPDNPDASKLAPVAPPPIPTAVDKLPLDKFKLP